MNVEQRHDVQAVISGRQLKAGSDIARRGGNVPLQQGNNLRAGRGAGCMQYQCLVIIGGRSNICFGIEQ